MDDGLETRIREGYGRQLEFVLAALEDGRPTRDDWRAAVEDAVADIARIVDRDAHPDDVARARQAISSLLGIWLTPEEGEAIYLDGREP